MTAPATTVMECDVLVIGSGAAGLAAAVTAAHHGLRVIVAEKADVLGGTSAWSGGWLWIPMNPLARAAAIMETVEAPLAYLRAEMGSAADDPRVSAFLQNAPQMVSFFAKNTALAWIDGNLIPDFHDQPGHAMGGRSVAAKPYDGRDLGPWITSLRPPLAEISLAGMGIAGGADMRHFFNATRKLRSALYVAGRLVRHARDLALHGRAMQLVNGNALVARLIRSALDKGVAFMTASPAVQLLQIDGRISGAVLATAHGETQLRARCGVVLATGGFPHDAARLTALTGAAHFSAAPRDNTGDGLTLGTDAGGHVPALPAAPVAWAPVSLMPRKSGGFAHFPHLIDRAKPGIIAVGPDGKRFANEADSYHDVMAALIAATPPGQPVEAWLIADSRAIRRWGLGAARPFPFPLHRVLRSGYLKRGTTLTELATACGLPADALLNTVTAFNAAALRGCDPDFGRGASAYNQFQGDPEQRPNPSLGPLTKAPFYAVRLVAGSLGTFAGLQTNARAQVLTPAGVPVAGLFAVGNDMASIMGGTYPSGGITLGPGMTFGYIAGRVLADLPITGLDPDGDNHELL